MTAQEIIQSQYNEFKKNSQIIVETYKKVNDLRFNELTSEEQPYVADLLQNQYLGHIQHNPEGDDHYTKFRGYSIPIARWLFANATFTELVHTQALSNHNPYCVFINTNNIYSIKHVSVKLHLLKTKFPLLQLPVDTQIEKFIRDVSDELTRNIIENIKSNVDKTFITSKNVSNICNNINIGRKYSEQFTWAVVHPSVISLLKNFISFIDKPALQGSVYRMGTCGGITVYCDVAANPNQILFGFYNRYNPGYYYVTRTPFVWHPNGELFTQCCKVLHNKNCYHLIEIKDHEVPAQESNYFNKIRKKSSNLVIRIQK